MERCYPRLRIISLLFMAWLFFQLPLRFVHAQTNDAVKKGVVHIKLRKEAIDRLHPEMRAGKLHSASVTGIESLDYINSKLQAKIMRRLFRPAGKYESRHQKYGLDRWYEVVLDTVSHSAARMSDALSHYQSLSEVEVVEPVRKIQIIGSNNNKFTSVVADPKKYTGPATLQGASNDPLFPQQWHYDNTGQSGGTPGADIRLLGGWQQETGNKNVVVAVIDIGVDYAHEDLSANMWVNEGEIPGNNIDDDNNGFIDDIHGYNFADNGSILPGDHGTHVAGTVAAVTNNGKGVAGIAGGSGSGDGIRLMSCQIFGLNIGGIEEAFVYAADNGAIISQNSWGYTDPQVYEQSVLDGIDYFIAQAGKDNEGNQTGLMSGGLAVFAAGNSRSEEHFYPAFYSPTIAVAATSDINTLAFYSNFGSWVDISAPGGESDLNSSGKQVLSTLPDNRYGFLMGTSMACPHVSGVAALIVSKFGKQGFASSILRERLVSTARNIDQENPGFIGKLGAGLVDASAALGLNDDTTSPAAITDLTVSNVDISTATLSWTVPHEIGSFIAAYDIRYSLSSITEANFNAASKVNTSACIPSKEGTLQSFTISQLSPGTLYYFAIKSTDFVGNVSSISSIAQATMHELPALTLSSTSISVKLLTAQTSVQNLKISNTGRGALDFSFDGFSDKASFASPSETSGHIEPGQTLEIAITFDANGFLTGSFQQPVVLKTNDPEHAAVDILLTLNVENNNAPITIVKPDSLNFFPTQIGVSKKIPIEIHNSGSGPLIIHKIVSHDDQFNTDLVGDLTINTFASAVIGIIYSPTKVGHVRDILTIESNDPGAPVTIQVNGEGTQDAPLAATPPRIDEILEQGTIATKKVVVKNNTSEDFDFHVKVKNHGLSSSQLSLQSKLELSPLDTVASNVLRKAQLEKMERIRARIVQKGSNDFAKLLSASADIQSTSNDTTHRYFTGFEEFFPGDASGQFNWLGYPNWQIANRNPDEGQQHLSGISTGDGVPTYVISPEGFSDSAYYSPNPDPNLSPMSSISMRINLDNAKGAAWEIGALDFNPFLGFMTLTTILIDADGTIDITSLDENDREIVTRIDMELPKGYVDIAIEQDNRGIYEGNFNVYFNAKKVFSGRGEVGTLIRQVAVLSYNDKAGLSFDIDNLEIKDKEYIPPYLKTTSSLTGIIPARDSITLDLTFDATSAAFGENSADLIIQVGGVDELMVPTTLKVTGEPMVYLSESVTPFAHFPYGGGDSTVSFAIENVGGSPLEFTLSEDIPWFSLNQSSGVIPVRGRAYIEARFTIDTLVTEYTRLLGLVHISTNDPKKSSFDMFVGINLYPAPEISVSKMSFEWEVKQNEAMATTELILTNSNDNGMLIFSISNFTEWLSVEPKTGKGVFGDQTIGLNIDTEIKPGVYYDTLVVHTNDPNNATIKIPVRLKVLEEKTFPGISDFSLVDKKTGDVQGIVLRNFAGTVRVDLTDPDIIYLDIRANVNGVTNGSIKFSVNGREIIDNLVPYDLKQIHNFITVGTNVVTIKLYEQANGRGNVLDERTIAIDVVESPMTVSSFSVVNSLSGEVIANFMDTLNIDINDPLLRLLAIRANTVPVKVGRIVFSVHGEVIPDAMPPYDLLYVHELLYPGANDLTVDVYSHNSSTPSELRDSKKAIINLIGGSYQITGVSLISRRTTDRSTDVVLQNFADSVAVDVTAPGHVYLAIRATTNPADIGSVGFKFDSTESIVNLPPYDLRHIDQLLPVGRNVLTVSAYSGRRGLGQVRDRKTIIVYVPGGPVLSPPYMDRGAMYVEQGEEPTNEEGNVISVFPNPVHDFLHINGTDSKVQVIITTTTGVVVYQGTGADIRVSDLAPGIYTAFINEGTRRRPLRFLKL